MGADEKDLTGSAVSHAADFEVLAGQPLDRIGLGADRVTLGAPLPPDARRGGVQRLGVIHIALADLAREPMDMGAKPLGRAVRLLSGIVSWHGQLERPVEQ
jgi:hypothetical protein